MSDLTKRLRKLCTGDVGFSIGDEAADKIEALEMHVERLEYMRHKYANMAHEDFNAGMQAAAERSAEIAQQHSYAGAIPQAIREAFGQGK